ncbi:alcohol dehydrogenase [Candidatus Palauibacter soopunensis]|uniref:alcohol dehydrogenase n=1 Tax=Candidatus Palauibacter soopunensis TaxID=3056739 RepID=UPI00239D9946|nr:alcohol dehydrogenase [Candidatus Palauibacter soopunensis]MDE2879070.1 alcohol dehydrogenase [Candidatus Palauibacter soopunensis]
MKSYQFREYGEPLGLAERPTPEPAGSEVLVRIHACGVCHSDLHLWQGYFEMGGGRKLDVRAVRELPFTLGHEIVGEVAGAGPDAEGVDIGDARVVFPWIGCGACDFCDSAREHLCNRPRALGTHVDGGFADHVIVPHPRYMFDFGDVPPELACTYACSGLTAYSALRKAERWLEDKLVIIGAGGVGFAGIQLAKALFDADLIVVEVDDAKLEAARRAGAAHVVDGREDDASRQLKKLTNGGCAAVVDFAGSSASTALGFRTVAKSGTLVVVGLLGGSLSVPVPLLVLKDLAVQGSDLGSLAEMEELMELVRSGRVDPIPYATRPMDEAEASLRDLEEGGVVGRIVLTA